MKRVQSVLFIHSGGFYKEYTFAKAKELGYGVILAQADYKGANPNIDEVINVDIYNLKSIPSKLKEIKSNINAVVTFSELGVEACALISEQFKLIGNSTNSATNCRDKYVMRKCFYDAGIPSVKSFSRVTNIEDIKTFSKNFGFPLILKPTNFGGSAGVVRINNSDDVEKLFNFVQKEIKTFCEVYNFPEKLSSMMVETMIEPQSTEVNVDLFIHKGEPVVISIAEKPQNTEGPTFQENDYVMPAINIDKKQLEEIEEISKNAVKSLGLKFGAAHLEAKVWKVDGTSKYAVIEVGARCGGDLEVPAVKASTGFDLSKLVIKQALGNFDDKDFKILTDKINNQLKKSVAVQVIYAPKNGVISEIVVPDKVKKEERLLDIKFEYKVGDKINMHYSDYVGAIMVKGENSSNALKLVNELARNIKVEIGRI